MWSNFALRHQRWFSSPVAGGNLIATIATRSEAEKETATKSGEYRRKKRREPPVTVASLRLSLRPSTGPNRPFQPQSLGRVRDPVRIAEGPTAIDAATQRRHFRLRLVDNLQPIGGAWQRPRREDGKRRGFALHTAQTRPAPRFRSLHEVCTQGVPLHVANDLVEVVFCFTGKHL